MGLMPSTPAQTTLVFQANSFPYQYSRSGQLQAQESHSSLIRTSTGHCHSPATEGSLAMTSTLSGQTSVPGTAGTARDSQGQSLPALEPSLPSSHSHGTTTAKDERLEFGLAVPSGQEGGAERPQAPPQPSSPVCNVLLHTHSESQNLNLMLSLQACCQPLQESWLCELFMGPYPLPAAVTLPSFSPKTPWGALVPAPGAGTAAFGTTAQQPQHRQPSLQGTHK